MGKIKSNNRKKNKRCYSNEKYSIEVARKGDVILIESSIYEKSEAEIKELLESIEKETLAIKRNYYSLNSQVIATQNRSFVDLVNIFFSKIYRLIVKDINTWKRHITIKI